MLCDSVVGRYADMCSWRGLFWAASPCRWPSVGSIFLPNLVRFQKDNEDVWSHNFEAEPVPLGIKNVLLCYQKTNHPPHLSAYWGTGHLWRTCVFTAQNGVQIHAETNITPRLKQGEFMINLWGFYYQGRCWDRSFC